MFKKLKEKIAEEVKQSPLKIQQLAQSVVSPGSSSVVEPASNENFSIGDDDSPQDALGKEGFTVVDLHHPSTPLPPAGSAGGRMSRQSSMSSLASDASSAFFSVLDSSLGAFNMQMDLESASEKEDSLPQLNNVSKEELYHAYMKLHRHYQKYKGRAHDLRSYCRELDKDNKKHKAVLLECQEKSLRRMAELKEQCALEQHAKAHLEEALRYDLEEKDHLIQTLQTKIKLLKETLGGNSSVRLTSGDENTLSSIEGRITAENSEDLLDFKDTLPEHPVAPVIQADAEELTMNPTLERSNEENFKILKEKLELFQKEVLESTQEFMDIGPVLRQCQELVNCMNVIISSHEISGSADALRCGNRVLPEHQHEESSNDVSVPKNLEREKVELTTVDKGNQVDELELKENPCEQAGDILELTKLIIKQETFFKVLDKIANTFEGISSSSSTVAANDELLDKQGNLMENSFSDILNEMYAFKENYKKDNLTENDILIKDSLEKWKSKLYSQMDNSVDVLINVMQKYKVSELNVIALNKSIKENRDIECLLKEKDGELNRIYKDLEKTMSQKAVLSDQLSALQKELEDWKQKEGVTSQSLLIMETKLRESELNSSKHYNELINVQGDKSEIAQQKMALENAYKASQTELSELKEKYNHVYEEMISLQKENKEHDEASSHLESELTATRLALEEETQQKTRFSELYSEKEKELNEMKKVYATVTEVMSVSDKVVQETKLTSSSVKADLENTKMNLDKLIKDNSEHEQKVIDLRKELDESEEKCKELKEKLVLSQQEVIKESANSSEVLSRLALMQEDLEKEKKEKEDALKTIDIVKQEVEKYKDKCQMVEEELMCLQKKTEEDTLESNKLRNELSSLRTELASSVDENLKLNEMVADLQKEVSSMRKQNDQVTQELASKQQSIENQDLSITQMKEKLTATKRSLDEAICKEGVLNEALASFQREMDDATDKNKKINEELILTRRERAERESQCANLEQELGTMRKCLEESLSKNSDISKKLVVHEKQYDNLKKKYKEVVQNFSLAQERIKEHSLCVDELATKSRELEEMAKENEEMSNRLIACQEELKELSKEHELTSSYLATVSEKLKENEKKCLELEGNFVTSQTRVQEASAEKIKLNEIVATLQEELHILRKRNEDANQQLTTCRSRIGDLNVKVTHMRQELENSSKTFEAVQEALVKSNEEIKNLGKANIQLVQELEAARLKVNESDLGSSDIKKELFTAQRDLEEAVHQKNELENAFKISQTELTELKQKYDQVCQEVVLLQKKTKEYDEGNSHLKTELAAVRIELEEATCRRTELNELFSESQLTEMKGKCAEIANELSSSQKMVEEANLLNSQLKGDLAASKACLEEVLMEKTELDHKVIYLDEELCKRIGVCESLREELMLLHKKMKEENENSSKILYKLALTQEDLERVSKEKEELSTTLQQEMDKYWETSQMMGEQLVACQEKIEELKKSATYMRGEFGTEVLKMPEKMSSRNVLTCSSVEPGNVDGIVESHHRQMSYSPLNTSGDYHTVHKNDIEEYLDQKCLPTGAGKQTLLDEEHNTFLSSNASNVHKSEGSVTLHEEEGVELLRNRLSALTSELYETKEKYRKQMAASNKYATADSDTLEPDWDKMSIEMEYLRNIVYQYMMGKEPMLLAKVISAVMKFDEQQIDQIMQKELHKQTLLGQLGIL